MPDPVGQVTPRPWVRPVAFLGVGAALVGLAFLVARPPVPKPGTTPYVGVRGAARDRAAGLRVYYQRGGEEHPVEPGTVLTAGDRLRFVFRGERPRYLELRLSDEEGPVVTVFPPAGTAAAMVKPGESILAASAVTAGRGRVIVSALVSDQPRPPGAAPDDDTEAVNMSIAKE
jgi:hypothetical protein